MGLADFARDQMAFTIVTSFNPCFDGWGSPTVYRKIDALRFIRVSILVLMDGARRRGLVPRARRFLWKFQSLF